MKYSLTKTAKYIQIGFKNHTRYLPVYIYKVNSIATYQQDEEIMSVKKLDSYDMKNKMCEIKKKNWDFSVEL